MGMRKVVWWRSRSAEEEGRVAIEREERKEAKVLDANVRRGKRK